MNRKPIKIISLATMCLSALALLGIAGVVSPAFAAAGITINGSAFSTNYHQVTLALTAPAGSVSMSLRNESLAWSAPETVTAVDPAVLSKAWILSAGDGDKKVSVQFYDDNGNLTGLFNATIKLGYILDRSFYTKGYRGEAKVPGTIKTVGQAVAVQADQKIVVVGTVDLGNGNSNMEVIRYLPNGTPDFVMDYPGHEVPGAHTGRAVAIDSQDRIVVAGTYDQGAGDTDLWVMRLNPDGTPDTTFTGGPLNGVGTLKFDGIGGADSGTAVAIDSQDRIIVVGSYARGGDDGTTPWVIRLNADDGSLDTEFNETGSVTVDAANGSHRGNAVAIDSNDYIVVAGTYDNGPLKGSAVWTLRLDDTGVLDTAFGGRDTGENTYGAFGAHSGNSVAIDPNNGRISVLGTYDWSGGDTDIWLLQLDEDGKLDPTFNSTGSITLGGIGSGLDTGGGVAIDYQGRIVVVGTYDNIGTTSLLVQRLNADGSFDTSFNNGNSAYAFGQSGRFTGTALALQEDQRIVVAGMGDSLTGTSFIQTVRLHGITYPLTATVVGSGTAAVNLGALYFNGTTGVGTYVADAQVQLTATPLNGAVFAGWSGACTGTEPCTVTMDEAKSVTATFTGMHPLTVAVTGVGTITSAPGGISCTSTSGSGCLASFTAGTPVTLTATPPWYQQNGYWNGGSCSGSILTPCTITMDQVRTVTATFISGSNARVVGFGDYPTLMEAYSVANASGSPAMIQAKDSAQLVFQDKPLDFDLPVTVTLQGGKGSDFSGAAVGFTSVIGPLNISNGRLNASNLKIKQP